MSNCPDQQFIRATAWFLLHVSFASGSGVAGDGHHGWRVCQLRAVGDVIRTEPRHRGTALLDPACLPLPQGHREKPRFLTKVSPGERQCPHPETAAAYWLVSSI